MNDGNQIKRTYSEQATAGGRFKKFSQDKMIRKGDKVWFTPNGTEEFKVSSMEDPFAPAPGSVPSRDKSHADHPEGDTQEITNSKPEEPKPDTPATQTQDTPIGKKGTVVDSSGNEAMVHVMSTFETEAGEKMARVRKSSKDGGEMIDIPLSKIKLESFKGSLLLKLCETFSLYVEDDQYNKDVKEIEARYKDRDPAGHKRLKAKQQSNTAYTHAYYGKVLKVYEIPSTETELKNNPNIKVADILIVSSETEKPIGKTVIKIPTSRLQKWEDTKTDKQPSSWGRDLMDAIV